MEQPCRRFLVGDLSDLRIERYRDTRFLDNIDREHLVKCKENSYFQIVDLWKGVFFDPNNNSWKPIEQPNE